MATIDPADLGKYLGGVGPAPEIPEPAKPLTKAQLTAAMKANAAKSATDIAAAESEQAANLQSAEAVDAAVAANEEVSKANETDMAKAEEAAKTAAALEAPGGPVNQVLGTDYTGVTDQSIAKQVDATQNLVSLFNSYGLGGDIASAITNLVKQGFSGDTISLIAQDPKSQDPLAVAYRERFSGNAARMAKGLAPLNPSQYLNLESTYNEILRSAGTPDGFYNTKAGFANFIGNDVSPTELQSRVSLAKDVIANSDPFYAQQMQNLYGLDQGHAIAHLLDPNAAMPLIQKQVDATQFATAAAKQGLGVNQATAELYGPDVTQAQAQAGFRNIAMSQPEQQALAATYAPANAGAAGQELLSAQFGGAGSAAAQQELERQRQQRVNVFSGSAGAAKGSLGTDQSGVL